MFSLRSENLGWSSARVLEDVTLDIGAGERVALLGASGSGKSTLLGHLRNQCPQDIAWCPQDGALVPMLSVFHNIYMGQLHCRPWWQNLANLVRPGAAALEQVGTIATRLGLADKLRTSVDRLSGGQAQRVALGRALFSPGHILLADEPLSSVDEHQARHLLDAILPAYDCSVVALHDRQLALACSTRVIGLRDNRVVLDAATDTLTLADLDRLY
ncbi:MAG: ATP-binding cassette domain-containing protein [Alcanivoracaceae bacterium]|nr:ATP-binding cassette domain-containing protein [Alcanivoracaceae bacterium]